MAYLRDEDFPHRPMRIVPLLVVAALGGCQPFSSSQPSSGPTLVRLSDTDTKAAVRPCARQGYPEAMGFAATEADLRLLAKDLDLLAQQPGAPAGFDPYSGVHQVIGLTLVDGRRRLYVNVFPASEAACSVRRNAPCQACGGSPAYWGALYAPSARQFEELTFSTRG